MICHRLRAHVNLIPLNPTRGFDGGPTSSEVVGIVDETAILRALLRARSDEAGET